MFNVEMVENHIPGCHNVAADLLSRWQGTMADFNKLENVINAPLSLKGQKIIILIYYNKLLTSLNHWMFQWSLRPYTCLPSFHS